MHKPIQLRLTVTTLMILLLGMGLAALFSWLAVEKLYLDTQRENLLAQAQLTASALQGAPLPDFPVEPYSQTTNVHPGIHTRLVAGQGVVILNLPIGAGEIPIQSPLLENSASIPPNDLLQRSEIQSAHQGVPDTAIRRVEAVANSRVMYAAAPVFSLDGDVSAIVYLATPLPQTSLPLEIILQLVGAVLVAALIAGLAGAILSRRIARPLETLDRAASAVAAGDLDQQVPVDNDILELHNLGNTFNAMLTNLRQSEQAKSAFVADVTHELRTPLTVINGTIETLEDGALDDIHGRGALLRSMQNETHRLIRLVNDLLVLARADAGALNLQLEYIDLEELVRARCNHLSTLAAPKQVSLNVDGQQPSLVWSDADRLIQVLDNLLENAIYHSPPGSYVSVVIRPDGDEFRCTISDQGPGISAEHLSFIFERFYRVDSSRNRHTGGSGLGLAIVKSLVLAQNGRIIVESVEDQGTRFTFWLPANEICHKLA